MPTLNLIVHSQSHYNSWWLNNVPTALKIPVNGPTFKSLQSSLDCVHVLDQFLGFYVGFVVYLLRNVMVWFWREMKPKCLNFLPLEAPPAGPPHQLGSTVAASPPWPCAKSIFWQYVDAAHIPPKYRHIGYAVLRCILYRLFLPIHSPSNSK